MKSAPVVSVELRDKPDHLRVLLDRYWQAVKDTFPDEWQDRRDYILMQSIGLNAFAKFGGVLLERAWDTGKAEAEDFNAVLHAVKQKVSLKRDDYKGIAGAGGATYIADLLIKASDPGSVESSKIMTSLGAELPSTGITLDADTAGATDE
jgi:hypothetical protein